MKIQLAAALAAMSLLTTAPVLAQTADDPVVLNAPGAGAWNIYGAGQTHASFKDKDVQGGGGVRITVANATVNPWDVGMSTSIDKPIKAGDHLVVAVWAKAESQDANAVVMIPAAIGLAAAPYTQVISGQLKLTTAWQLLHFEGVSNADYAVGKVNLSLQLGGQPKKVDFGPAFVLDQGQ
jgi:hypothetical protein